MINKLILITFVCALGLSAQAATIAVIDSGSDVKHIDLVKNVWMNSVEIPDNDRDEDHNGYQDDVFGWNFAENNNQVIDYSYLGSLTPDIRKFFQIQTKNFYGLATEEEKNWVREKVQDQDFIKSIQLYGNFMHGTHVAGITVRDNDSKFLAVKLIPTEVKLPGKKLTSFYGISTKLIEKAKLSSNGLGMNLLKVALAQLAKQQMTQMRDIAYYIDGHKADIANGSFGTGYPQAKMIVTTLIKIFSKNPKEADIIEGTKFLLNSMISEGEKFVAAAPDTLFVFAAGNDGSNNDLYPASPTNIVADNVISVAATIGRTAIANFSNYGITKVDVAAPGVGIKSTAPGDKYMTISGTSQAAPFIANVASKIKDANPTLKPKEIKAILMKTVDLKKFLNGKVVSNGIVNTDRAVRAASLTNKMSLSEAISESRKLVADIATSFISPLVQNVSKDIQFVLPLTSSLILK